ncbi:fibrillarin-like rRNA/tRNA 2'-O-methyltransferase [Nanoarchaeota archaeon]
MNFSNVYKEGKWLSTKNAYPGVTHFDEREQNGKRQWDPNRSKLAAAIAKGVQDIGIKENDIILYLGAGHGYTPSFVSDIIGKNGMVFCLDSSPRVVRDLVMVCEQRSNMAPILGNANQPDTYKKLLPKQVDIVYQDVAQKNQVQIFLKNIDMYLKKGGYALLAVKARSVDVTRKPGEIFEEVQNSLEGLNIVEKRNLSPFQKDHMMFVCKKL